MKQNQQRYAIPQTDEEIRPKMHAFENAIERGELDHLTKESTIQKYERQLHTLVNDILHEDASSDSELQLLQSILSMVYTLKLEGRLAELNDTLKKQFPTYYNI